MKRLAFAVVGLVLLAIFLPRGGRSQAGPEMIFVQATAGGVPGTFLVDTGAPTSVLDAAFADRAHVRLGADQPLSGGGRVIAGRIGEAVVVQAQGGPPLILDPAVTNLSPLAGVFGHPMDGILGADYFARQVVSLDYRSGKARFEDPAAVVPPPTSAPLRLLTTPFVEASADFGGRKALGSFQIDTGSNTAVTFWGPFMRKAFPEVRGVPGRSLGIGGELHSRTATLDRLELAGRTLQGLTVDISGESRPDDAGPGFIGAIGGPAFAGRVLHLDYVRARMWVE